MEQKNHGSPSFINIAVLLLFAVVIAVASTVTTYFFLSSKSVEQPAIIQPPVISPVQTNNQTNVLPTAPPATTGSQTTTANETASWKVYRNENYGFEIKYPSSFSLEGLPVLNKFPDTSLDIRNFQWNQDAYRFPYLKYPTQDKFYLQLFILDNIDNLSIKDWLNEEDNHNYGSEKVQIINEYKQMGGTLVSEKQILIDNKQALQRIIRYYGSAGSVDILFSYVKYENKIYQFIGHSTTDYNLKIYNKILSTFKFIE